MHYKIIIYHLIFKEPWRVTKETGVRNQPSFTFQISTWTYLFNELQTKEEGLQKHFEEFGKIASVALKQK